MACTEPAGERIMRIFKLLLAYPVQSVGMMRIVVGKSANVAKNQRYRLPDA
jgi:hypothetical protein